MEPQTVNPTVANKPAFGALGIQGAAKEAYLAARTKAEGSEAVAKFMKYLDEAVQWGYVRLENAPKSDLIELSGSNPLYSKKISTETPLDSLRVALDFMKKNNAIIDQKN